MVGHPILAAVALQRLVVGSILSMIAMLLVVGGLLVGSSGPAYGYNAAWFDYDHRVNSVALAVGAESPGQAVGLEGSASTAQTARFPQGGNSGAARSLLAQARDATSMYSIRATADTLSTAMAREAEDSRQRPVIQRSGEPGRCETGFEYVWRTSRLPEATRIESLFYSG